jgi:hypothetical protein
MSGTSSSLRLASPRVANPWAPNCCGGCSTTRHSSAPVAPSRHTTSPVSYFTLLSARAVLITISDSPSPFTSAISGMLITSSVAFDHSSSTANGSPGCSAHARRWLRPRQALLVRRIAEVPGVAVEVADAALPGRHARPLDARLPDLAAHQRVPAAHRARARVGARPRDALAARQDSTPAARRTAARTPPAPPSKTPSTNHSWPGPSCPARSRSARPRRRRRLHTPGRSPSRRPSSS